MIIRRVGNFKVDNDLIVYEPAKEKIFNVEMHERLNIFKVGTKEYSMRTKTLNIPEFNENKYYLINEEVKSPVYVVKVKNDKLEYLFGCREDFIKSNQVKEFKEEEWFLGIIEDNPLNITIDDISTLVIEIASRDDIDLSKLPYTEYDLAVALIMKDMSVSDVNQTNLSKIFE